MTEREQFEAMFADLELRRDWTGEYTQAHAKFAWAGWQASRKQALEEAAGLVESVFPPLTPQGGRVEVGERARSAFANAIRSLTTQPSKD